MSIKDTSRDELLRQLDGFAEECAARVVCIDCHGRGYTHIDLNELAAALKPIFEQFYEAGREWQSAFETGRGYSINEPNFDEFWEQNR